VKYSDVNWGEICNRLDSWQYFRDWLAKEIKRMCLGIKDKADPFYAHECRENLEFAKDCARALRGKE
jgi:hypothetical protein